MLTTLLSAMVLFGAATNLIDLSAAFIIEGFRQQKFEDELELRVREMLRTQLADVPTRAEIDEYEQKQLERQLFVEAEAERERLAKIRERELKKASRTTLAPEAPGGTEGIAVAGEKLGEQAAFSEKVDPASAAAEAEAAKRRRKGPVGPGGMKGFKQGLEPRVARLIIAGESYHGLAFTAQGFLENCRCVRFQWSRSRDGVKFVPIPGATLPSFFATADDVGHIIRVRTPSPPLRACGRRRSRCAAPPPQVEAHPVTDDGYEGHPATAQTRPLHTMTSVLAKVHHLVDKARNPVPTAVGFVEVEHGLLVSGVRATLRILTGAISARTKTSIELGSIATSHLKVILDRTDHYRMVIEDPEKARTHHRVLQSAAPGSPEDHPAAPDVLRHHLPHAGGAGSLRAGHP